MAALIWGPPSCAQLYMTPGPCPTSWLKNSDNLCHLQDLTDWLPWPSLHLRLSQAPTGMRYGHWHLFHGQGPHPAALAHDLTSLEEVLPRWTGQHNPEMWGTWYGVSFDQWETICGKLTCVPPPHSTKGSSLQTLEMFLLCDWAASSVFLWSCDQISNAPF